MPKSCNSILKKLVFNHFITNEEYEKLKRNLIVARCSNCKFAEKNRYSGFQEPYRCRKMFYGYFESDFYCGFAERRTDETD